MRKLILLILPALYLGACTEPAPPPPPPKTTTTTHHHHKKTEKADDFHAVEKPQTYR
ncbi:MAG TPA: hypothetical protein VJS88_07735 [Chthoniobacterales bacterium]|nr:hypothetical protein [Chthoniobacterales bacterium]